MSLVLTFGKASSGHLIPDRTLTLPIPMATWLAATLLSTFLLFLVLTATQLAVIAFLAQNLFPPQLPSNQIPELFRTTLLFATCAFGISLWLHAWLLLLGDHHPATAIGMAVVSATLVALISIKLGFGLVAKTALAIAALAPPIAAALLANRCRYHAWTEWKGLSLSLPALVSPKNKPPSARRARARFEWHEYGRIYLLLTIYLAFVVWFCGILFDFGRTSPLHAMLLFSSACIGAVGAALCGGALQEIRASQAQKTRPAFFSLQAPMTTRAIAEARIWAIARGALVPMAVVTVAYFLAQLPLLLKMDGQQLDQYRWHTLPWAINTSIVFLFVIWMLATHNWRFILYAAIGVGTMEFAEEFAKRQGMSPNILAITTTLAITLFLFFRACKRHLVLVKPLLTITAAVFLYLLLSLSRHLTTLSMDDLFRALGTLRIDDLGTLAVFWLVALWPALTIPVTIHNQRHR